MSFGARFLHQPDLFPARPAGEPWGTRELSFALPGGLYRFHGLSGAQEHRLRQRFGSWCLSDPPVGSAMATESLVLRAAPGDFRAIDTRGWVYDLDTETSRDAVRLAGLRLIARLDWRPHLAGALWTPDGGEEAFPGVFENFFRVLVAYRLLELGGVMLHSAGVLRGGEAFLFPGRSGAGKTTVASACLARGALVLSDDLNALRAGAGRPLVERLPFTGDLGGVHEEEPAIRPAAGGPAISRPSPSSASSPSSPPLRALLRLDQATRDELVPLSRAETLACLLACSPFVNADPHRRSLLVDNLAELTRGAVGACSLRFTLSGTFWHILEEKWPSRRAVP